MVTGFGGFFCLVFSFYLGFYHCSVSTSKKDVFIICSS